MHPPRRPLSDHEAEARGRIGFPIGAGIGLLIGFGVALLMTSLWSPPPPIPGSDVEDDLRGLRAHVYALEAETPAVTVHAEILVAAAETAVAAALPDLVDEAYHEAAIDHADSRNRLRDDLHREMESLVIAEVDRVYRLSNAAPHEVPLAAGGAVYVGPGLNTHDR